MMQVPSSNHSTGTSRRANTKRKAFIGWFDGFIDKACCAAAGYAAGDEVDDNSIAYSEKTHGHNENFLCGSSKGISPYQNRDDSSIHWDAAEKSIQWTMVDARQGRCSHEYNRSHDIRTPTTKPPLSPRSDATATTVLTGSSSSSRGVSPRTPPAPTQAFSGRAHSTGTMRRPEDEWRQQEAEQRPSNFHKVGVKEACPREVLVPVDWQHEHGLRRTHSDTLPKLPFPTVQPRQRVYNRTNK